MPAKRISKKLSKLKRLRQMKKIGMVLVLLVFALQMKAAYILIPMDAESQQNHLKGYGITYWVLSGGVEAWWLLNYRGGSFAFPHNPIFEKECLTRGISYEILPICTIQ